MLSAFQSKNEYVLENERVLLRPLQSADFEHLLPFALNEPETWHFSNKPAGSADLLALYIKEAHEARASGSEYPFIVFDKKANLYAGSTRFYDIQPETGNLQLGYTWYGKDFRGTGVNKHCKFLLLQFAFEQIGIERVEFRADARNDISVAAMKSIGCTFEGLLRSHRILREGGRGDSIILSILKDEWFSVVKEKLEAKIG